VGLGRNFALSAFSLLWLAFGVVLLPVTTCLKVAGSDFFFLYSAGASAVPDL